MRAHAHVLTLAAFAALAVAGCAERDRANPFDPANQATGGRPVGFAALARERSASLVWNATGTPGLVGYQIWRRTASETTYHAISSVLAPSVVSFSDFGLLDGLDHFYRLYFVLPSGLAPGPAEDVATPGPQTPWVADGGGALLEITADGRHVAARHGGLAGPTTIAADTAARLVWCSDPDAAQVRIFDASNGVSVTVPMSGTPGAIATVPADSTAWVCREDAGAVVHLSNQGQTLQTLTGLQLPLGVAISGFDGSLWVCDRAANRLQHRDPDLGDLGGVTVPAPSRVAIDASTGDVWVTSFTNATVWKLSSAGATLGTFGGFSGPVGIAVDAARGNVWVADPAGDRVRVLAPDGTLRFEVGGIPGARSVALDAPSGEAWVVAISSGEIVRLAPNGTVIRRLGGIGAANDITVLR